MIGRIRRASQAGSLNVCSHLRGPGVHVCAAILVERTTVRHHEDLFASVFTNPTLVLECGEAKNMGSRSIGGIDEREDTNTN